MPTLEQRFRIFELLTTLTPHYTKECTRHSNPLYAQQARDRYASLIGHNEPSQSSWFSNLGLGLGGLDGDQLPGPSMHTPDDHKYFFAINLYNSFDVVPDLFSALFKVSAILGFQNVYVSIYENGSNDQTKALLRIFDALCKSVGLRVQIRTSMRTRGNFNHRIEYLAEVRNAAFVPLHELRDAHGELFDTIVFMNDVLPCVDDLLELIWQSRLNNAGITCAADYMYHNDLVRKFAPSIVGFNHSLMTTIYRDTQCFMTTGSHATLTAQPSRTRHLKSFFITRSPTNVGNATYPFKYNRVGTGSQSSIQCRFIHRQRSSSGWRIYWTTSVRHRSVV